LGSIFDAIRQDVKYSLRQIRRAPLFAGLVIATLAIGIGANATMTNVIDRLLFRPPSSMRDAENLTRLVSVYRSADGVQHASPRVDYPTYISLTQQAPALSGVAGYMRPSLLAFASADPGAEVKVSFVTANYFETLGARPFAGRFFVTGDGFPATAISGGPNLVVLSYGFWQRQFGGKTEVLGNVIRIGVGSYTVMGIGPQEFAGVEDENSDVYLPITAALETLIPSRSLAAHDNPYLSVFGRIRSSSSRERVELQTTAVLRAADALTRTPNDKSSVPTVVAAPIVAGLGPDAPREFKITLWLGGVSVLVLLIVCANVANLMLSRALSRRQEISVRLALGASRNRLARQLLTEALVLSGIGGALGFVIAMAGGRALQQMLTPEASTVAAVDLRMLMLTAMITLGTAVCVSLLPMHHSAKVSLKAGLAAGALNTTARGVQARSILLAVQATLCVVLMIGAGLFSQSLRRVQGLDLGVDLEHTVEVSLGGVRSLQISDAAAVSVLDEMRRELLALPGVKRASFAQSVFGGGVAIGISTPERSFDAIFPPGSWSEAMVASAVDSGLFRTLGLRSLRGREFTSSDVRGGKRVAILNAPLANRLFPNSDALGKCVIIPVPGNTASSGECVEIVGVMSGYYRRNILNRDAMVAFVPIAQQQSRVPAMRLYLSTSGNATLMVGLIQQKIRLVRPDLRAISVKSMQQVVEPEMRPWNLAATMFMFFGGVALIIAVIGLYAVVSFNVTQRTREIAVRLALGARAYDVVTAICASSSVAVATGLLSGVLIALFVRKQLGVLLFETSPADPMIIAGVALALFVVAIIAMVVPISRALRVNPTEAMKN